MVSEQVKQALQRIVAIVSGWDAAGGANEIERELVLGKLRELYEQVKFMDAPAEVSTAPDAPAAAPQPEAPAETGNVQAEPAADTPPAPSTDFEAPVVEQAMADEASLFDMGEMACQASRNSTLDRRLILSLYGEAPDDEPGLPKDPGEETVVEKVVVAEIEPIEEDDAPEEEPTQEPEIETEPEPEEEIGSEPAQEPEPDEEPEPEIEPTPEPEEEPAEEPEPEEEPEPAPEPNPAPEPETPAAHKVLGEVFVSAESLGDSLSRGTRPADIASRVASARTISLRQSLGINDRFLVISAVFKDNREAYEKVIDELDALDDLDEAMIHIYENYAWDPNNEGVKVLIDLLTRKLS